MNRKLQILHRPGCHLCDDMHHALMTLVAGRSVEIELTDIERDSALLAQYQMDIPVLLGNGVEICRHHLDEAELEDFLAGS